MTNLTRLDFSLETAQERIDQVNEVLANEAESASSNRLEYLADYILDAPDTREKTKPKNRKKTISAHEISYEGLVTKFENGEDGLYNLTIENDKNIILAPKTPITQEDIDEIPALKELTDAIIGKQKVIKTNNQAINMIYENELGGLNYDKNEYYTFGQPKKKTGPKTGEFLYEEIKSTLK
jgi:hypothetical protein